MFALLERLIFLLFVVSLLRSVMRFIVGLWRGSGTSSGGPRRNPVTTGADRAASGSGPATLLHQDPVCGTYVAADTSLKRVYDGKVVHFCSPECRDRYRS
jgi:YHS domain-containing protein